MSNEEVGIYIKLLCLQHQHGGIIPKEPFNAIALQKNVRTKFIECEEGFYNERLMSEMNKRKDKSQNLSKNALIRWDKHRCKSNAIACDLHMPIEDEDENINNNINLGRESMREKPKLHPNLNILLFEKWYNKYPRQESKVAAIEEWTKLTPQPIEKELMVALSWQAKSEQWTKESGKYIPLAVTYLRNRKWEDRPTVLEQTELPVCDHEEKDLDGAKLYCTRAKGHKGEHSLSRYEEITQ